MKRTIPIKSLTLISLSLNEICRLFQYTPLLRYFKVSVIREEIFEAEYHQSPCSPHLKELIIGYFKSTFDDLTDFLQNMSNLRSLTIHSSKDPSMVEASYWEQLTTFSLPYLKNFRFTLTLNQPLDQPNAHEIFDRFQTDFWLKEHQWYTEYSVNTQYMMIYTIPYITEYIDISFPSKRYCNPLIDNSQTFKHVKKLYASGRYVFEHDDYHFPRLTSLAIAQSRDIFTKYNKGTIKSLMVRMDFSHLKHLEILLDCRSRTPSLLFQILDLAPRVYSLRARPCFFEVLLLNKPESYRYLNGKIRKLDISVYFGHTCDKHIKIPSLYQLVPNLEQLTMSL